MVGTALVTGGTGYIASHLVPALVGDGWRVRACGRRPRPESLPPGVEYHRVDLAEDPELSEALEGVSHVFHLAGASSSRSSEAEMQRSNVGGTESLLAAAVAAGVERVLHMSSTSVYGEEVQLPVPVPETVEPRPSRGYGKAKWQAEQVVWRYVDKGLDAVVLRPVSVHGPGATKLLASALLDVAVERFMGLGTVLVHRRAIEQRVVHVADVVGACRHLMAHDEAGGRAFNLVMPAYPTSHEVAGVLADELGLATALDDDVDCGPTYEERAAAHARMRDAGMRDDILLTEERFRFMRKANRNNRLSIDALLGTGFVPAHADLREDVAELARWCESHRWIV